MRVCVIALLLLCAYTHTAHTQACTVTVPVSNDATTDIQNAIDAETGDIVVCVDAGTYTGFTAPINLVTSDGGNVILRGLGASLTDFDLEGGSVGVVANGSVSSSVRSLKMSNGLAATGDGGCVRVSGSAYLLLSDVELESCVCSVGNGGCVAATGASTLNITGSTLSLCSAAAGNGGAVSVNANAFTISDSIVETSTATSGSAAVHAEGSTSGDVLSTTIRQNECGGVAATGAADVDVSITIIDGNDGVGARAAGGSLTLSNSFVVGNDDGATCTASGLFSYDDTVICENDGADLSCSNCGSTCDEFSGLTCAATCRNENWCFIGSPFSIANPTSYVLDPYCGECSNECAENADNCPKGASCKNTRTGFTCSCKGGNVPNGNDCVDPAVVALDPGGSKRSWAWLWGTAIGVCCCCCACILALIDDDELLDDGGGGGDGPIDIFEEIDETVPTVGGGGAVVLAGPIVVGGETAAERRRREEDLSVEEAEAIFASMDESKSMSRNSSATSLSRLSTSSSVTTSSSGSSESDDYLPKRRRSLGL